MGLVPLNRFYSILGQLTCLKEYLMKEPMLAITATSVKFYKIFEHFECKGPFLARTY